MNESILSNDSSNHYQWFEQLFSMIYLIYNEGFGTDSAEWVVSKEKNAGHQDERGNLMSSERNSTTNHLIPCRIDHCTLIKWVNKCK